MAQYWEDWSGSTLNEFPTGWTRRFGIPAYNQWKVKETGGVRFLEAGLTTNGSTARQMISMDAVDSDSARVDFEIAFKWQCASVGTSRPQMKGAGRASGDATVTNAYLGGFDNSGGGHRIQKYVAGTSTTIQAITGTVLANTNYITRSRVSGSSLKLKTWLASESEPEAWNVETTDASFTASGWVGLFCLNTTYVYKIAFIGIATGGDVAPTEEPVPDSEAPILSSASATTTGSTTASGSVTTDEGNGTLYYLGSSNSSELAAVIKAGQSKSVSATGIQSVTLSGLTPETSYYLHFLHRDASGNDSDPLSTSQFTTEASSGIALELITSGDTLNAHPTNSSIVDPTSETPTVNISVRVIYSNWRQFVFRLTGANGKRPIIKISPTGYVSSFSSVWRPWYSYDGLTWLRFDTAPVNNTTTWDFQHSSTFTGDVYVAYQPAWQVARVPWLIGELEDLNSGIIHELPSSPGYEHSTPLTAQTDELGNTVPSQKMYAFGIWDNTVNPEDGSAKRNVIITGGVHAGEHVGSWAMEGFLRYLFSGSAKATDLLKNYKFHVYPLINPMGRYMGHYRGQRDPAGLTMDPNRDYPVDNSPSTLQSSTLFRSMLSTDLGSQKAAFSLDFHGTWGDTGSYYFYSDPSVDINSIYLDEWHTRIQAYSTGYTREASLLEVTVDQYLSRSFGQKHSYVPEMYESSGFSAGTDSLFTIGSHYAQALADSPLSEMELPSEPDVQIELEFSTTAPAKLQGFVLTSNLTITNQELKDLLDGV